jgi:hypothetical protein
MGVTQRLGTIPLAIFTDASNNVGIGTSSPSKKLEIVSNTSQDGIKISGSSNPRLTIIDTTNSVQFDALTTDTEAVLRTDTNHPLVLSTNGTARLTIASTGAATFSSSVTSLAASGTGVIIAEGTATNGEGLVSVRGKNSSGTSRRADFKYDNADVIRIATASPINMQFETNDITRMTITSGGNVFIGTTSTISSGRMELLIGGNANGSVLSLGNNGNANKAQIITDSGENMLIVNRSNTPMILYTNNTERMRITSGGNVLIGTTTDSGYRLSVNGASGFFNNGIRLGTAYSAIDVVTGAGGLYLSGSQGALNHMLIGSSGDVTIYKDLYVGGQGYKPGGGSWANSSDIRLKENVKTIDNALDKVLKLRGVTFDWKVGYTEFGKKESAGFIADEVMEIFPEWVSETNASDTQKEIIEDDKIKSLSLPFHFDALLVEAIKEISNRLSALENKS